MSDHETDVAKIEVPGLPTGLAERLPEHLDAASLEAANQLYSLRRNCEDIIAMDGEDVPSEHFGKLSVSSSPLEIGNDGKSLFARTYKGESKSGQVSYGFIFAPTPEPASNYDAYALVRIEHGREGRYELVVGGDASDSSLNDLSVIKFLQEATDARKVALIDNGLKQEEERKSRRARRRIIAQNVGAACVMSTVALAAIGGIGKYLIGIDDERDHPLKDKYLSYIHKDQSATPKYVQLWTEKPDQEKFLRVIFDTKRPEPGKTPTQCKIVQTQNPTSSRVTSVTDYRHVHRRSEVNDANQFTVTLRDAGVEVCWAPNFKHKLKDYSTVHPTVGIKITDKSAPN